MAKEYTLVRTDDVRVTNVRLITPDRTYYISKITSVGIEEDRPAIFGWVLVLIIGLPLIIPSFIALLVLLSKRTKYFVHLHTAGGENDAYWSFDEREILRIVRAIDDAIIDQDG